MICPAVSKTSAFTGNAEVCSFEGDYFSIMPEMTICWTWVLPS